MAMNAERGRQIEQLYRAVLEQKADDRESFLAAACGADDELREQVASLLAADTSTRALELTLPTVTIAQTSPALTAGQKLGPYQIGCPLGEGGMGKVYRAIDTRLGRAVAVKISSEQFSKRFDREAQAISALNHPNICTLYDVGSLPSGAAYMITELVEGETLRDWLKHSPTWSRRLEVILQVIEALRAAHEVSIVHRDLKPANIMVRFDGYVKVLDFGLAKRILQKDPSQTDDTVATGLSVPGQIVGTVAYMSPEQILGEQVDARSDLFALGIILYEIVAGRYPWPRSKSAVDAMHATLHNDPGPIEASHSTAIEPVILRCLAKKPERRFQSAGDLRIAIEAAVRQPGPSSPERRASIAILPFANMSADKENEYFGDGLAEEIINVLANAPGINVAARTSSFFFRGKDVEFGEIGRKLNVEHVLEGSIRRSGNRLRVTAQLIKVNDGFHLWSERYDREMVDIFAIQDEITQAIAEALRVKLSPKATARHHVPNLRAYEAYLKARDLWFNAARPELLPQFKELLERATVLDPEFALAYSFLGIHYTMQANLSLKPAREVIPLAVQAEEAALRIDPTLPEAHAVLACCIGPFEFDWNRAEQHWRLAMAREPVSRDVLFWYGNHHLLLIGRTIEAVDAMSRGLQGDPLNLTYRHHFARGLRHAGRLAEAEAELRGVLELDQNFPHALATLGSLCAQQGRFDEAFTYTERAYTVMPRSAHVIGQLAGLLAQRGATDRADTLLENFKSGIDWGAPTALTAFNAICGNLDAAADWAEKAIEQRDMPVVPNLGPFLRPTARWPALARAMNLPG